MKLFFEASNRLSDEIADLFDFLWSTSAAMWNLRWQVKGYLAVRGEEANMSELSGRFIIGSGLSGVNFKKSYIDQSWEEQQEQFAKFLLINIFALYEQWVKDILTNIGYSHLECDLQRVTDSKRSQGIWYAINTICSTESSAIKNSFYSKYITNKKYSASTLDNLMRCFKFFKECRNCIIHKGGIADKIMVTRYQQFRNVATIGQLGINEVPLHNPVVLHQKIKIELRGVVGFADVILRIIATCDAEFSRSFVAEKVFLKRWREFHQHKIVLPKPGTESRLHKVTKYIQTIGYPCPDDPSEMETFLKTNNLIF
ncbi:MAG TPA: hypothetical protein VFV52_02100 [Bacilli bacterium]|nr:hypothetical protein [Bacilli bacterium]